MTIGPEAERLDVEARFAPGVLDADTTLSVTQGAEGFVRDVRIAPGTISQRGDVWVTSGCEAGCTVAYRFALREAAELGHDEVASGSPMAPQAPAGSWLLRPMALRDGDTARVRVHSRIREESPSALRPRTSSGVNETNFVTGLRGTTSGGVTEVTGPAKTIGQAPYTLFGDVKVYPLKIDAQTLNVGIVRSRRDLPDETLVSWAGRSARAVADVFGRFPIDGAVIGVLPGRARDGRVGFGRAMAGPLGGSILVDVGNVDDDALATDWVLVHEMLHLGFPSLERRHRWMEEGLATYLEPLVRARAGLISPHDVWFDYVTMMPNGLPAAGDRGLDLTPTWGRVYWGGALFCLVADVEIRRRTHGQRSLDDALRAILDAGGNNGMRWPIEHTFAVGDGATGATVLSSMYAAWRASPVDVDLDRLFQELGVRLAGDRAELDDRAPLASVRHAMTRPAHDKGSPGSHSNLSGMNTSPGNKAAR